MYITQPKAASVLVKDSLIDSLISMAIEPAYSYTLAGGVPPANGPNAFNEWEVVADGVETFSLSAFYGAWIGSEFEDATEAEVIEAVVDGPLQIAVSGGSLAFHTMAIVSDRVAGRPLQAVKSDHAAAMSQELLSLVESMSVLLIEKLSGLTLSTLPVVAKSVVQDSLPASGHLAPKRFCEKTYKAIAIAEADGARALGGQPMLADVSR